jgi:hypothetical protein
MASIGRNDPCPCGSGKKYKRCCLAKDEAVPRFSRADRPAAFARLEKFSEDVLAEEDDAAHDEFWDDQLDEAAELDEPYERLSTDVFDMWFWFDLPLDDDRLVVDRLLAEDASIPAGERRFLELLRETSMHLYGTSTP